MHPDCIHHVGLFDKAGYGRVQHGEPGKRRQRLAHRVAYCEHHGIALESIDGLHVRHSCDNPPCVNGNHLLLGTHDHNMRDKVERNRQSQGEAHGSAKLTAELVQEIRAAYVPRIVSQPMLARRYGISQSVICDILNHKLWPSA